MSLPLNVTSDRRDAINELSLKQHVGVVKHSVFQRHDDKLQTLLAIIRMVLANIRMVLAIIRMVLAIIRMVLADIRMVYLVLQQQLDYT